MADIFKGYRTKDGQVMALYQIGVGGPVPYGKGDAYAQELRTLAEVEAIADRTEWMWKPARDEFRKVVREWPEMAPPAETLTYGHY